ncbi:MAG: hypothetical protein AAB834_02455, partial [Patescibacteria group bacterium]
GSVSLGTPSGNGVSFSLETSVIVDINYCAAYIWTGTDSAGGTNWTLTCTNSGSTQRWGFTCLVFRATGGIGASNATNVSSGAPSLGLTTTGDNSAIAVFNADWQAISTARTWRTVNSITPSVGNGLETTYATDSLSYTAYAAYYNDAGATGAKTVGLTAPAGQRYSIVAVEVLGPTATAPEVTTLPVTDIGPTTATGNGSVDSDGGDTITERGVCWSTSLNPTTANSKATAAGTTGTYSVNMTGLTDDTLYHARAYAINSIGTSYGADVTFQNHPVTLSWIRG